MVYYVIAHKLQINRQFKNKTGELISCPEIGLGEEALIEPQMSIPFFINSIKKILGPYKLQNDGFFYKINEAEASQTEAILNIEVNRYWGVPGFRFQFSGIETLLYLPSIKLIREKDKVFYSFLSISKKGLDKVFTKYMTIEKFETASFNFGAINKVGHELVRTFLELEDEVDPNTGFSRRREITDEHRASLKKEISLVDIHQDLREPIQLISKLDDEIEKANVFLKKLKEKDQ
jgi:hypothetical protein